MCGRYSLAPEESSEILAIVRQVQDRIKVGEIFPTNPVPVMLEADGVLAPEVMTWGYPRFQESKGRASMCDPDYSGQRLDGKYPRPDAAGSKA